MNNLLLTQIFNYWNPPQWRKPSKHSNDPLLRSEPKPNDNPSDPFLRSQMNSNDSPRDFKRTRTIPQDLNWT